VSKDEHKGTSTPPGSAAVKGIRSRPKLEKHSEPNDGQ
jgi:hypothetical protein